MNPYEKHLNGREPLDVIKKTPNELESVLDRFEAVDSSRSDIDGEWSVYQIIVHLLHTEINYSVRLRNALTNEKFVIQPFDQEKWVERELDLPIADAMSILCSLRNFNLSLIRSMTSGEKTRLFEHPEIGEIDVSMLIEMMAGHDLAHLSQLKRRPGFTV